MLQYAFILSLQYRGIVHFTVFVLYIVGLFVMHLLLPFYAMYQQKVLTAVQLLQDYRCSVNFCY